MRLRFPPSAALLGGVAALAGGAAALAAAPAPANLQEYKEAFQDRILLPGKAAPISGVEVTVESYEKIEYKPKSGALQTRKPEEVASIQYADTLPEYTRALEAWKQGRWADAEQDFRGLRSAVSAGKARKMWDARAMAYVADCRRRMAFKEKSPAKLLEAAETFAKAEKADPKSPLLDLVLLGRAECLSAAGKHDDGLAACDDLKTIAGTASLPLWEARARRLKGRILEQKGEVAAAANEYQDLANFAGGKAAGAPSGTPLRTELEALKVDGLVSKGWAIFGRAEKTRTDGDIDAARAFFESLPASTGSDEAGRAASLNGLGAVLLLQGKPKEALDKFLTVEVTLFAVPSEVTRSLWYKAKAYEQLGDQSGCEAALKDLVELYPWSEWATRAR